VRIHTFRRPKARPCAWRPATVVLTTRTAASARAAAASIAAAAHAATPHRPRRLLAFINPYGGSRAARGVWERTAAPLLGAAGVRVDVVETAAAGHARDTVRALTLADAASLDGLLAVGGDGLFHELLNGLLDARAAAEKRGDAPLSAALARLRLGHVPAGSTDALAYSIHGTRSPAAAALHVALGDSARLDALALATGDGSLTHAACVASYGYMGDMLALSERLRWLGPGRYGVAGAVALAVCGPVSARVAWRPAPDSCIPATECGPACGTCAGAGVSGWPWRARARARAGGTPRATPAGTPRRGGHARGASESALTLLPPPAAGGDEEAAGPPTPAGWRALDGRFRAVMLAALPCRSDAAVSGLAPERHMADGLATLIAVRDRGRLSFLRFLVAIARGEPLDALGPHVTVATVTAATVAPSPGARGGRWNADGEPLRDPAVGAAVLRGAVAVFARGTPAP